MKLLNQSLKYLSISILAIVTIWAVIFYVNMLNEIKDSIDEGLENYKRLIIKNAQYDSTILNKNYFDENFFTIRKIDKNQAISTKDQYLDTVIYMQDMDDDEAEAEPVRMLTSAFEINGQFYELKVANSMVEEDDLIDELFWSVLWLYIVLILSIIFINNRVLKKLWKPFYGFLNQLKEYRLGETQQLPEINTKTKEFLDLQKVVNTSIQQSLSAFEQQKQFIGNASHELQTPLAIVTNKLELLLENESLKNTQAKKVTEIFQIIQRLVRLNKSLLLLSKIENKQFFDNKKVSINQVVLETINELEEYTLFKKIKTTITATGELFVYIDPTLANVIVSNLLKNALSHNIENGTIGVEITADTLKICNTGNNQMLNSEKIFEYFYKSESEANGTGLGLSIIKAISNLYEFPITYSFQNNTHCFEMKFITP